MKIRIGSFNKERGNNAIYAIIFLVCISLATVITLLLQAYTRSLLRDRLNERLTAIAATAALQFNGDEVSKLRKLGEEGVQTPLYKDNLFKLQKIRAANKNIMYAYILAQTDDPTKVIFIIDADAASLVPVVDFNEDGVIDDEDVSTPGEIYDATDAPALQGDAFIKTTVDPEITVDSWGQFLSAYSPIYSSTGEIIATLTIDVEVTDFQRIVNQTYFPFLLFVFLLLLLISALTLYTIRIWKSRVSILRELDRQKDELLSLVSHQLAAPVSALKWYLEMLLDGDLGALTKQQEEQLKTMKSSTANLSDLVSMILDVSRIQLGRMILEKKSLDLNEFFKEIFDVVEPKAIEKKIALKKNMPTKLPSAMLDRRYTRMTIENLLTNAVKYTPAGGKVDVHIAIGANWLHFSVKDTGCGIPEADQQKIFGKMFRASNVRNSKTDGNGFGLFIAKGAVENQNGKIWFESTEGHGTTFFVDLPLS